ncbi:hypothetical protein [Candidatus Tisiphia endosymbiont of Micropterix aruncella]|uniref:hypothetical protein n=1 Tax=Candidatus Tisiphia endosymbiont of Micropterix aruncella TaxID=3066271 RepID=UPI003AA9923F
MINGVQIIYPLLITVIIILVVKSLEYKVKLYDQGQRLYQFYIDSKFINALIVSHLQQSNHFKSSIIRKIKDYFQLDDVLIVKYSDLQQGDIINKKSCLSQEQLQEIMSSYYDDYNKQVKQLDNSPVLLNFLTTDYAEYILYIFFAQKIDQESIICIQKQANEISRAEIVPLSTAIHLLKIFLDFTYKKDI